MTPHDGGSLNTLSDQLDALGFRTQIVEFESEDSPAIKNLYARIGDRAPNLCFAGHTDVVPPGELSSWSHDPFSATVEDGVLYGRGAVDMKGGIAAFVAAASSFLSSHPYFDGSISFLITGDEEGPAINGTDKLLKWITEQGETIDACVLGEPTNPETIGDAIKVGRRGSLSGEIIVDGVQGHVAYPHLARNPIPVLLDVMQAVLGQPLDAGNNRFQPSNLEFVTADVGNPALNVIPVRATAKFNIRFNDIWTADTLASEIEERCVAALPDDDDYSLRINWKGRPSPCFLTRDEKLINTLSSAIETVCGKLPEISTGGGTSDARFIKDYCPVVEFGLVGQTMHQVDERVELSDLQLLTRVYETFLERYFA